MDPIKPPQLTPLRSASGPAPADDEVRRAAKEFEAVFLSQTVEEMLRTVELGSFGGGHAEETWRGFLARAFADEIAESGTTGIAQSVEKTMAAYRGGRSTGDDT
jgi:Rod binding domain-containing protein